jgi:hypothetical protein
LEFLKSSGIFVDKAKDVNCFTDFFQATFCMVEGRILDRSVEEKMLFRYRLLEVNFELAIFVVARVPFGSSSSESGRVRFRDVFEADGVQDSVNGYVSPLKGFSTKLAASASFSSCRAASRFSTVMVLVNEDRFSNHVYIFFDESVRHVGIDRLISEKKTNFLIDVRIRKR